MEIGMIKASEAVAAAGFERNFDGGRAGYLAEIHEIMQEMAGVPYSGWGGISESIHPGSEAWKDAYDCQVPARTFVERTIRDFGFVRVGSAFNLDEAGKFNRIKAAMCEFSATSAEWLRGPDGTLFNASEDGVAIMKPILDHRSGRFGFGIEFREGAEFDPTSRMLISNGTSAGTYGALDMREVLHDYNHARKIAAEMRDAETSDFRL